MTVMRILMLLLISLSMNAQQPRKISKDLFGIFFEDISYAADGGLYAELIQNRSFEYSPGDLDAWNSKRKNWNNLTSWDFTNKGYGYGRISVETSRPVHENNPHYVVINVDEAGSEGVGIVNRGFDGIVVKQHEKYSVSLFLKQMSASPIEFELRLLGKKGDTIALQSFVADSKEWKKYSFNLTASRSEDTASLAVIAKVKSQFAIDMVSMFPVSTYKNRANGLRSDLAEKVEGLQPKFMRFPGGCLVHGDGLANIYKWKNTIGPVEERIEQKNIWNYHQTGGLGYFEYFQFCEDIGAKAVPVVAAGVSCQNSGGTWRTGGTGQRAIDLSEMDGYIRDILDLIEWANGPATSTWGAKRAAAGHPAPFGLKYLGIGNEDKITPEFEERFTLIYNAVKAKHPEITLIGTSGPFHSGEDYDKGWVIANKLAVPIIDEHYYEKAGWFLGNNKRYDTYDRKKSGVYLGEYATKGNTLADALAEACFMTSLERNGDVVKMASYAPMLAKSSNLSWSPDLIYFTNNSVKTTVNYEVQKLFSNYMGDLYYDKAVSVVGSADTTIGVSCVKNSETGRVVIKLVNAGSGEREFKFNLGKVGKVSANAEVYTLTGEPASKDVVPAKAQVKVGKSYKLKGNSFVVMVIGG
ncbi:MAG: alpha-L-arabinofuranosidase C-terminal domain-containing protein [Flavitalea sp.]